MTRVGCLTHLLPFLLQDGTGKLPIHWAAMKESPLQVMELLLKTNPTSISQLDKNGKAPLHLIAKNCSRAALDKAVRCTRGMLPELCCVTMYV